MQQFAIASSLAITLVFQSALTYAGELQASAGVIYLNRDSGYQGVMIHDTNGHDPVLSSSDFETGWAAGFNTELTYSCTDNHSINARFLNIDGWDTTASATSGDGAWLGPYGGNSIDWVGGTFSSNLYSFEVNAVCDYTDWLRFMAGFRWIGLDESIHFDFMSGGSDYADGDGFAKNDLYGAQGGADVVFIDHGPLTVDGAFKAGVYGANTSYDAMYVNGVGGNVAAANNRTAFVGDIVINTNFALTDNCEISAGYQLLWISGVSLANQEIAAANWGAGTGGNPTGYAFYHGAVVNFTIYH